MFNSILVIALLVVCPAIAITLPNGFVFDETKYLNKASRVANVASVPQTCETQFSGCADDCSTSLTCDENSNVVGTYPCTATTPYCVKNAGTYIICSGNFPMSNPTCLNKALNNFVCTADGTFPDPTDCTKYHVCNGANHNIVECPASHKFSTDPSFIDQYINPGNGEFVILIQTTTDVPAINFIAMDM